MEGEAAVSSDDCFVVKDTVDGIQCPCCFEDDEFVEDGVFLKVKDVADVVEVVAELEGVGFIGDAVFGAEGEELAAADAVPPVFVEGLADGDPCFGARLTDVVKGKEMLLQMGE